MNNDLSNYMLAFYSTIVKQIVPAASGGGDNYE